MNVLVVTNMYPAKNMPFYGIFVKEQVESLRKEGITVDVAFINGRENRLNYFTCVMDITRKLKSNHYDMVHAHHTYGVFPARLALLIARKKVPFFFTFHEGEVHSSNQSNATRKGLIKKLVFSKSIKRFALNMVDQVIFVQEDLRQALFFRGKSSVLPCGVDMELFKPMDKTLCRKRLNLPTDKQIILFPASPEDKQKGYDVLMEALDHLDNKEIHVLKGGGIRHEEMPYYMNAADVIVQLSLFEASPMTLKEAMSVNVPVVFTDVGDARTVTGNTAGCFLCDRTPPDAARKIDQALNCNGESDGRRRIVEIGLGLSDVAKEIVKIYHSFPYTA